jgi:hypothetical protein
MNTKNIEAPKLEVDANKLALLLNVVNNPKVAKFELPLSDMPLVYEAVQELVKSFPQPEETAPQFPSLAKGKTEKN